MKALRVAPMVVLALAGVACGPRRVWVHPTATQQQIARDDYECRLQTGYGSVPAVGMFETLAAGQNQAAHRQLNLQEDANRYQRDMYNRCLAVRGYALQPRP